MAILQYQEGRLYLGMRKMKASAAASNEKLHNTSDWACRSIKLSVLRYLVSKALPTHQQCQHSRRREILIDLDIKRECLSWIRRRSRNERSLKELHIVLQNSIFSNAVGEKEQKTSYLTVVKYPKSGDSKKKKMKKQLYMDGHERKDVENYRECWSKRMIKYKNKMDELTGEGMDVLVEDKVEVWENKHVHVTHSKSTFCSNDGKDEFWVEEGDT